MKKKLTKSSVVAVIAALSIALSGISAFAALPGDFNGDGSVNSADARMVLRVAVGLEKISAKQLEACDIDGDGKITASDARNVLRTAVGFLVNEYDILYSDSVYVEYTETINKTSVKMMFAATDDSVYIPMDYGEVALDLLCKNGNVYFINQNEKTAFRYTNKAFEDMLDIIESLTAGTGENFDSSDFGEIPEINVNEISKMTESLFPSLGPLSGAKSVSSETLNGTVCKVYNFVTKTGTAKVYMKGASLKRITSYNSLGQEIQRLDFSKVLLDVPSMYCSLDGYAVKSTGEDLLEFFLNLFMA